MGYDLFINPKGVFVKKCKDCESWEGRSAVKKRYVFQPHFAFLNLQTSYKMCAVFCVKRWFLFAAAFICQWAAGAENAAGRWVNR